MCLHKEFNLILNYITKDPGISDQGRSVLESFVLRLQNKSLDLKERLRNVKDKYTFENMRQLENQNTDPLKNLYRFNRLGFWMERYQYNLIAGVEGEMDLDFGTLINESDVYIDTLESEASVDEMELIYEYSYALFYTWFGFMWQKEKLYACGIPMCIEINSTTTTYYLNDFSYNNLSVYHNVYPETRINGRGYKRDLSLEEIFITTYITTTGVKNICLYAERENHIQILALEEKETKILHAPKDSLPILIEHKTFPSIYSFNIEKECSLRYLISEFKKSINLGWIFKLEKTQKDQSPS